MEGFSGHFMPETVFLCRLNLLYVIHAGLLFFGVVILASNKNKKKLEKNSSLCLFLFLLNSMLFGEKNNILF